MAEIDFKIRLPISPSWGNIEMLRTSVLNCLGTIFRDTEFCHAVSMITSELLENAVKYGDWEQGRRASFRLRVAGDERQVQVEVSNPVKPDGRALAELAAAVEYVRSFPSAEEAYRARLREVSESPSGDPASRLGLVRIAYEGHCEVGARVDEDSVLHVTATTQQQP